MSGQTPQVGAKMDKLPELWQSRPKAHKSVVKDISTRMTSKWTFVEIYEEVLKSGIQDDDDIMETTWALRDIRDHRKSYQDEVA